MAKSCEKIEHLFFSGEFLLSLFLFESSLAKGQEFGKFINEIFENFLDNEDQVSGARKMLSIKC